MGLHAFLYTNRYNIAENDEIQLSIWNIGHHDLLVHAMSLEVYK